MHLERLVAMVIGATRAIYEREQRAPRAGQGPWEETSRANSKGLAFDTPIKSKAHQNKAGGSTVNILDGG